MYAYTGVYIGLILRPYPVLSKYTHKKNAKWRRPVSYLHMYAPAGTGDSSHRTWSST